MQSPLEHLLQMWCEPGLRVRDWEAVEEGILPFSLDRAPIVLLMRSLRLGDLVWVLGLRQRAGSRSRLQSRDQF